MEVIPEIETFKEVKGFPGYYISNLGRVKSIKKNRDTFKTLYDDSHGYLGVGLWKNNRQYPRKVHRLVAEAFIDNPLNLRDINHKDEDKKNNCVANLEWVSHKDNLNYGTRNKRANISKSKYIIQLDKNGNIVGEYLNGYEAQQKLGISESNISECCNGKRKTAGGYVWKFKCKEKRRK